MKFKTNKGFISSFLTNKKLVWINNNNIHSKSLVKTVLGWRADKLNNIWRLLQNALSLRSNRVDKIFFDWCKHR